MSIETAKDKIWVWNNYRIIASIGACRAIAGKETASVLCHQSAAQSFRAHKQLHHPDPRESVQTSPGIL